ncbi:DsrE family protein [Pseudoalteromonas sp. T1lg10]|uniref:DsrE family protein n=1 Tax=Pseudoalteromonas sp. T1lg10 TaxID=2077093 RepID=UPI000CF6856A|nr:DsrE family protein [Pseudoalteromonas sp. T1lg10]
MKLTGLLLAIFLLSPWAYGEQANPVIQDFGYFYQVPEHATIAADTRFKIAFDVAPAAKAGEQNNHINSLARFINMHVAHGVKPENIELALVVHGGASVDVLSNKFYKERFGVDNKNQALIRQLLDNNTQVFVCGQSATHYKISAEQLVPGVQMALSAMTAHAQLQQQGYTLNPF